MHDRSEPRFAGARGRRLLPAIQAAAAAILLLAASAALATDFHVNSPADVADANHGDGICETVAGNGVCTLRAAIQEANAHAGPDTIYLEAVTYLLTSTASSSALDEITDDVSIVGAGPASTIIDGNGDVLNERVILIAHCPGGGNSCGGPGNIHVNISGVTIRNGKRISAGGGIFNSSVLVLADSVVTANVATAADIYTQPAGGGIYNDGYGTLTLAGSVVSGNSAISMADASVGIAGGIFSDYRLTVIGSTISGNTAGDEAGGIFNHESVTIINSTISDNTAGGNGGGLVNTNSGPAIIRGSTFTNNSGAQGGGIYSDMPMSAINSTFSGNFASASGGGLHVAAGTAGLFNTTVTQNLANTGKVAAAGGGIAAYGTVNLLDSIVAVNDVVVPTIPPKTARDDCAGTITSQGYNIVLDVNAAHCTILGGGVSQEDPMLGPLQYNGGPTQTHALPLGSPAIDAGNAGGCTDNVGAILTADQRGFPRPAGTCDIGAFELSDAIFVGHFEF